MTLMKLTPGNISTPYLLAIIGGVLAAILGTSVLFGWYTHNEALIQVSSVFAPMQYNTALGFLLSGLGILVVTRGWHGAGIASGISVMLIGLLTLAEYILGIELGIDQLLMQHDITVETSHPGRMAPNTALCFFLTGVALTTHGARAKVWQATMLSGVLGSIILGLGIIALAGYAIGLETAYGWGELTRMAVHTASGFILLGVAVTSLACYRVAPGRLPSWFPVSLGIAVVTIMITLWQALESRYAKLLKQYDISGELPLVNDLMLIVGIMLAVTLSLTVHLALAARYRKLEVEATNLRLVAEIELRVLAEEELLRFEQIVAGSTDMMALLDKNSIYLAVNPSYASALGLSKDELIGRTASDAFGEEFFETVMNPHAKRCFSGEKVNFQDWFELPMRGRRYVDVTYSPYIKENRIEGYVVDSRDITERKQVEQQLIESEARFRAISETALDGIILIDDRGTISHWNPAAKRIFGYAGSEALGKDIHQLLMPDHYREANEKGMAEFQRTGTGAVINTTVELGALRKDGSEIDIELSVSSLDLPGGRYAVGLVRDVTEKKRLAQELDQHSDKLEELVEERTVELTEARQRAEAANRTKSTFLANMSHEIRTPMNAIIGLTHLLQRAESTPEQSERFGKIDVAAEHLLAIINDILDLSKIEAGKVSLEQSDFRLDGIFDHVQSLLKAQVGVKGLTIEVDQGDVPRWLKGDPTRLQQALLNYAGNAIKFTEQGTISLRAKKLEELDGELLVRFEVQDTGIGIEPDKLPNLFKAFEQADTSITRVYGGSGLGLVITRRLAQLMGGEVGVESEPGRGSTFWFTARFSRGQPVTSLAEDIDAETELRACHSGARVLLVEDNAINREVALALLSSVQLAVDTAENGRVAVDRVRATVYDLVLMDIQMPEMDGLEATRLIRAMADSTADDEELPILAMTANIFEEDRKACLEAGMNDFVAKPIDLEDLFSTILKWLPEPAASVVKMPISGPPDAADNVEADVALGEKLASIEGIDTQLGLRNMRGDAPGYLRLLRQFDTSHGDDMRELAEQLARGEDKAALRIAHTVKGAAGTLGLTRLQAAAGALEEKLRSQDGKKDAGEVSRLIAEVNAAQNNFHMSLAPVIEQVGTETTVEPDPVAAQKTIDRLIALLEKGDTAANALFLESEALLQSTFGAQAEQLGQQIEAFDYPAALKTAESIRN